MIVKNILTGIITKPDKLRFSTFKPSGLKQTLQTLPKFHYVLGVGYVDGDFQICISGRKKKSEEINIAALREMYEELSLISRRTKYPSLKVKANHFFKFNINELVLVENRIFPVNDEDSKERAVICVHGDKIDIENYFYNVRLNKQNTDNITHIWADTVDNILSNF